MAEQCPTCGGAVKIVLGKRQCYESVMQEEIERLSHLYEFDHKLADRFRAERNEAWGRIAWLERELADCTRDCRKAGARFEQALDLLVEVGRFFENEVGWEELRIQVQAYLDSE